MEEGPTCEAGANTLLWNAQADNGLPSVRDRGGLESPPARGTTRELQLPSCRRVF